eukprot:6202359-Pleurochrysis_carterae.AAC.3
MTLGSALDSAGMKAHEHKGTAEYVPRNAIAKVAQLKPRPTACRSAGAQRVLYRSLALRTVEASRSDRRHGCCIQR